MKNRTREFSARRVKCFVCIYAVPATLFSPFLLGQLPKNCSHELQRSFFFFDSKNSDAAGKNFESLIIKLIDNDSRPQTSNLLKDRRIFC